MWWSEMRSVAVLTRLAPVMALAALLGGCFQPLYSEHALGGGNASVAQALHQITVDEIKTPRGTRIDRVGYEIRSNLIYSLTGGNVGPLGVCPCRTSRVSTTSLWVPDRPVACSPRG